jgi:hypothetical protein
MKNTAATPQRTGRNIKTPGAVSRKEIGPQIGFQQRRPQRSCGPWIRLVQPAVRAAGESFMGIRKLFAAVSETASASTTSSLFLPDLLVEPAPTLSRWDSCPSWLSQNTPSGSGAGQLDKTTSARLPAARTAQVLAFRQRPLTTRRNYFYGNKFNHATFVCRGGQVHCGTNNSVVDSKITIEMGADESALSPARVALVMRKKGIHRLVNCDQR